MLVIGAVLVVGMLIFLVVACFKTNRTNETLAIKQKKTKSAQPKRSAQALARATEESLYKTPLAEFQLAVKPFKTNEPSFAAGSRSVIPDPNIT